MRSLSSLVFRSLCVYLFLPVFLFVCGHNVTGQEDPVSLQWTVPEHPIAIENTETDRVRLIRPDQMTARGPSTAFVDRPSRVPLFLSLYLPMDQVPVGETKTETLDIPGNNPTLPKTADVAITAKNKTEEENGSMILLTCEYDLKSPGPTVTDRPRSSDTSFFRTGNLSATIHYNLKKQRIDQFSFEFDARFTEGPPEADGDKQQVKREGQYNVTALNGNTEKKALFHWNKKTFPVGLYPSETTTGSSKGSRNERTKVVRAGHVDDFGLKRTFVDDLEDIPIFLSMLLPRHFVEKGERYQINRTFRREKWNSFVPMRVTGNGIWSNTVERDGEKYLVLKQKVRIRTKRKRDEVLSERLDWFKRQYEYLQKKGNKRKEKYPFVLPSYKVQTYPKGGEVEATLLVNSNDHSIKSVSVQHNLEICSFSKGRKNENGSDGNQQKPNYRNYSLTGTNKYRQLSSIDPGNDRKWFWQDPSKTPLVYEGGHENERLYIGKNELEPFRKNERYVLSMPRVMPYLASFLPPFPVSKGATYEFTVHGGSEGIAKGIAYDAPYVPWQIQVKGVWKRTIQKKGKRLRVLEQNVSISCPPEKIKEKALQKPVNFRKRRELWKGIHPADSSVNVQLHYNPEERVVERCSYAGKVIFKKGKEHRTGKPHVIERSRTFSLKEQRAKYPVDSAIDDGVAFLKRVQNNDGSWGISKRKHRTARGKIYTTTKVLYALLESGVSPDGKAIQNGFDALSKLLQQTKEVPDLSMALLALSESYVQNKERHSARPFLFGQRHDLIRSIKQPVQKDLEMANYLVRKLNRPGPKNKKAWIRRTILRSEYSHGNNTVPATYDPSFVLAMHRVERMGIELPDELWRNLFDFWLTYQDHSGPERLLWLPVSSVPGRSPEKGAEGYTVVPSEARGWSLRQAEHDRPVDRYRWIFSAYTGVLSLKLALRHLKEDGQLSDGKKKKARRAIRDGLSYITYCRNYVGDRLEQFHSFPNRFRNLWQRVPKMFWHNHKMTLPIYSFLRPRSTVNSIKLLVLSGVGMGRRNSFIMKPFRKRHSGLNNIYKRGEKLALRTQTTDGAWEGIVFRDYIDSIEERSLPNFRDIYNSVYGNEVILQTAMVLMFLERSRTGSENGDVETPPGNEKDHGTDTR